MAVLRFSLMTPSSSAIDSIDATGKVVASEGVRLTDKEALNVALKVAKTKPSIFSATIVVCVSWVPLVGRCASSSMCVVWRISILFSLMFTLFNYDI